MQGAMLAVWEIESNKSISCPQRVYVLVGKGQVNCDKYLERGQPG